MRPLHRILIRNRVHRLAAEHLQAHLKFKGYKKKTSAQVLWALLETIRELGILVNYYPSRRSAGHTHTRTCHDA